MPKEKSSTVKKREDAAPYQRLPPGDRERQSASASMDSVRRPSVASKRRTGKQTPMATEQQALDEGDSIGGECFSGCSYSLD